MSSSDNIDQKRLPQKLLDSNQDILVNLSWQFVESPIDLDVSVVIYDKYATELKSVYFNEKEVYKNLFRHSGDNRDGKYIETKDDDEDENDNKQDSNQANRYLRLSNYNTVSQSNHKGLESIAINLSKLSNLAHNNVDDGVLDSIYSLFIIVNIHDNQNNLSFKDIESGKLTISNADFDKDSNNNSNQQGIFSRNLDRFKLECQDDNSKYTSLLVGAVFKHEDESTPDLVTDEWKLIIFEKLGFGINFDEAISKHNLIGDNELSHIYEEDVVEYRPNNRDILYNLDKGQRYTLHPQIANINVGLSWDPATNDQNVDMDASMILLDKSNSYLTIVNKDNDSFKYNRKVACRHLGDNKTGVSSNDNGDDETVVIDLDACSSQKCPVKLFAAYININSGASSFKEIANCYVRLYDPKTNKKLCECQLKDFGEFNGIIVYNITQIANTGYWQLFTKSIGIIKDANPIAEVVKDLDGTWDGDDIPLKEFNDGSNDVCNCNIL